METCTINRNFTNDDLLMLPEPVQRYFRSCGYLGTPKRMKATILWDKVIMRFSPEGDWKKIQCEEVLAAPEPLRVARLKTRVAGLIPLEATDKYQDGHGSLLVRLARLITIQNATGREMDISALVTFLSECLLLPACALQPYICWSQSSPDSAAATIRFNGVEARGSFYFNDRDEFIRFETDDRWQAGKGGKFVKTHWMVNASHYVKDNGIRRPRHASASWIQAGRPFEYYKGTINGIL